MPIIVYRYTESVSHKAMLRIYVAHITIKQSTIKLSERARERVCVCEWEKRVTKPGLAGNANQIKSNHN